MATLVFDVGGTTTRAGLFDPARSRLVRWASAPTPNHLDFPEAPFERLRDQLLALMQRLGDSLAGDDLVTRVDVAFAGPIDASGNVLAAPTVWGALQRRPFPLKDHLARRWPSAHICVLNDVTAAGYRYLRSHEDFCIVTVSSGIGNKVFVGGHAVVGSHGMGGELGHLRVDESPSAPECECGGRGHLGAVASGRGILNQARLRAPGKALTSGDLVAAFHRGEAWAVQTIEHGAAPLGWTLAAMHLGIGVERFVLVGGFALALGEPYREMVAGAAASRCWDGGRGWTSRVELGVNDDASGLIGAGIAGALREGHT